MTALVFSSYRPKKRTKKKLLPKQDCDHNTRHIMAIANDQIMPKSINNSNKEYKSKVTN